MKKALAFFFCISLSLTFSGCSAGDLIDQYISTGDTEETQNAPSESNRVYMDEIRGILQDFNGNQVTVSSDSASYTFDISQATVECQDGLLAGASVCVIYQGQLQDTDTSTVKALKVVDDYHQDNTMEENTVQGQLQNLTSNSAVIKTGDNQIITCPITGTEQYYQSGIQPNTPVYLHYKGNFVSSPDNPNALDGTHTRIFSISDIDPLAVPSPTPTPAPVEGAETKKENQMRAVIQNIQMNSLTVAIDNTSTVLQLNMTGIPCYFNGGTSIGSHVTLTYTGDFNGSTLDGITLLGITGEIPESSRNRSPSFSVTGDITASTANTITLLTYDGMYITCYTEGATNTSTGGLLTGSTVKVSFNPADCRTSNIYTTLKIEDA